MYFLRKASIKRKQTLIVMLTSGVALFLACFAISTYEVMTFHAAMVENLSTLAQIIGNNSSAALDFSDPRAAKETLSALHAEPNVVAGCIYTQKGEVFAVYVRSGDEALFQPPLPRGNSEYFSPTSLHIFRPITRDGEFLGTVYVVSDLNTLYSRLHQYTLIAVGVFLASGMVAFLLASWLQRLISGPILSLMQTAHSVIVEKNYSVRAVKESEDELGVLIDAFNEMLMQIQVRDADLQKSHIELEKRVAERTEEVINSLSLIRATLESTTDGILVTDGKYRMTSFNEKFIEMWKIPRALAVQGDERQMLENASAQLKDSEQFRASIHRVYADPEKESFGLVEFTDKKVFELYSKPQRVEEKCVGRVWSFRDITDRRRAEEQLERLSNEYKAVLNSLGEGVHWLDGNGQIKFENPVAAKLLGYEVSELIGRPAHATMHHSRIDGSAYPVSECPIYGTLKDGVVRHVGDEVFWRKDGTSFPVEYTSTPIHDETGRHAGTVVIFTDVTESRRAESELEEMHKQLLDTSRQAGMAEVATSVLHNVGNVLNSVNVSSSLVSSQVKKSKVASLTRVVALLNEHAADLGAFLTSDPKGKLVPHYLGELAQHLVGEQDTILRELHLLHENIEHIKDIVVMQQSYAKISGVVETLKISDLVEDALRLNLGSLQHHGVEVIREFEDLPPMDVEKHKILQILVNLVRNAKYACDDSGRSHKSLTLRITKGDAHVKIAVIDNGIGIPPENLIRIFSHGFTTRKEGHGFGLHSAALAAMEMGGSLKAESDGLQQGATFTLQLPLPAPRNPHH
jgi:PAS domain S-box-containing protein